VSSIATVRSQTLETGLAATLRAQWRLGSLLGVIALWVVVWAVTRGNMTLEIGGAQVTDSHAWFRARAIEVEAAASTGTSPVFVATNAVADALNWIVGSLRQLFTVPAFPRPLPQVGWVGVLALAAWGSFAVAGWRSSLLVVATFLGFGLLGVWEDSVDLLIITNVSVLLGVVGGIPLGIWMAHSKAVSSILTPVLDVMQTMPSFSYLLPVAIMFGIGSAAAVIVIVIYAAPPVIKVTAHGVRSVSAATLEATSSLGQTRWQRLKNVELPMARKTIIVGVNQTIMAALAMAVIAGYIDSPGLGQNVLSALQRNQLGNAAVAGLAIVLMAIMLDRTTTAASERPERVVRSRSAYPMARKAGLIGGGAATLVAVYLSHIQRAFNEFPSSLDVGTPIASGVDGFGDWLRDDLSGLTSSIQQHFTNYLLNPLQDLVANSPWFVTGAAIVAIAAIIGGWRAVLSTVACLVGVYYLDLWNNAMITITSVLVATSVVIILGLVLGVWMGRSQAADQLIRPALDAAQTVPAFVYLIPILIMFGPNRFTAIVAGVIYAVPPATKLIADGIRGVDPTTVEAARSSGTSRLQMVTKVQLPMAKGSLVLAANQGLLYVLSMVVVGGMVGAGALGADIVTGFRQTSFVGRGLAAAVTVVLVGIMLDRITRYGARRTLQPASSHSRLRPLQVVWAGRRNE
jgi:glycine betaine/proline transport system permease protein